MSVRANNTPSSHRSLAGDQPLTMVAIVDDDRHVREGLAKLINRSPGYRTTGRYGSMEEALEAIPRDPPDVVLMDIGLPAISGIEGVRRLKAQRPVLQILMLTVYGDDAHVFEAICAGACGYLTKDAPPARVMDAIRELCEGGAPMSPEIARKVVQMFQKTALPKDEAQQLSPREREVLKVLADGHSYKTAADVLSLSLDTVRYHIRHAYEKLHVHSKSEAVLKAFREGLLR